MIQDSIFKIWTSIYAIYALEAMMRDREDQNGMQSSGRQNERDFSVWRLDDNNNEFLVRGGWRRKRRWRWCGSMRGRGIGRRIGWRGRVNRVLTAKSGVKKAKGRINPFCKTGDHYCDWLFRMGKPKTINWCFTTWQTKSAIAW